MKCLIVDKMHESIGPLLVSIGWDYIYRPEITREEIMQILPEFDGLIIRSKTRVDQELISRAAGLKFIGRAGAGIDNLEEAAIEGAGISLLNAPEGNRNAVAEHTLGLILGLLNNIVKSDDEIRKGTWHRGKQPRPGAKRKNNRSVGIRFHGNGGGRKAGLPGVQGTGL